MVYDVTVRNRIITLDFIRENLSGVETEIVGGNKGDIVYFSLDDEWTALMSTRELKASFVWRGKYYISKIETDGIDAVYCYAPPIFNTNSFYLGIYVGEDINDPDYMSTTKVEIPCRLSIRDYMTSPQDDYGGNYTDLANEAADRAEAAAVRSEAAADRAEAAAGGSGTGSTVEVDATLTESGKAADAKATGDRLTNVEKLIADINYKAIEISSFSASPSTAEKGSTVTSVTLSWGVNKTPKALTLDGSAIDVSARTKTVTGTFKSTKTWTLKATDERDADATKTASLTFLNGVYYGAAKIPTTYDSAFILGLKKELRSSHKPTFSANAGEGQYIFYCCPQSFTGAKFSVGGFDGGFTYVNSIPFTNASGYTEYYYIYRSENPSLGATTVTVS